MSYATTGISDKDLYCLLTGRDVHDYVEQNMPFHKGHPINTSFDEKRLGEAFLLTLSMEVWARLNKMGGFYEFELENLRNSVGSRDLYRTHDDLQNLINAIHHIYALRPNRS